MAIGNKPASTLPENDYVEVFCKYIVKKGKRIYPKKAKYFHFFVKRRE